DSAAGAALSCAFHSDREESHAIAIAGLPTFNTTARLINRLEGQQVGSITVVSRPIERATPAGEQQRRGHARRYRWQTVDARRGLLEMRSARPAECRQADRGARRR